MNDKPHVLLFDDAPRLSERICSELADQGFTADRLPCLQPSDSGLFASSDLAVLVLDQHRTLDHADEVLGLLENLTRDGVPTLVWGMPGQAGLPQGPMLDCVPADASLESVVARLSTLARYGPMVKRLQREIGGLQRLGDQLNRYFSEIDQELRLAGRLQRDFLPKRFPQVPPLSFAALYRPASWVSGDMYDVFQIDEQHVGVLLTDAMGHGIAAGLLTMFLRQALVPKHVSGRSYRIMSPAEVMSDLNQCLIQQQLPNCQFVTGTYAIINLETLVLRVARGGHPHPIHITRDGKARELPVPGGLLGVPDIPVDFGENRLRLDPGDKVIFYTDGVEDSFLKPLDKDGTPAQFTEEFMEWAKLDIHTFTSKLNEYLDHAEGSLHPSDDMTILAIEVAE